MTNKERFIELLRSTKREGIEKLIDFLWRRPTSSQHRRQPDSI